MELIPVFSLIVLVATVATFILAIGAYVMFRIRESSGRGARPALPENYDADVFVPQPVETPQPVSPALGAARRESLKDPHIVRMAAGSAGSGETPAPEDGRRWQ